MNIFVHSIFRVALLMGGLSSVGMNALATDKDVGEQSCPMQVPPIERKERLSQPGVLSVTLSKDRLRAAVLLKDGYAIQIYHSGCEHVGFDATRWIDELPKSRALQLQAIRQLIKTGLPAIDLKGVSLKDSDFRTTLDGSTVRFEHVEENLNAVFTHQDNGRYLLSVFYALPY